jgi:hypothetical protein
MVKNVAIPWIWNMFFATYISPQGHDILGYNTGSPGWTRCRNSISDTASDAPETLDRPKDTLHSSSPDLEPCGVVLLTKSPCHSPCICLTSIRHLQPVIYAGLNFDPALGDKKENQL